MVKILYVDDEIINLDLFKLSFIGKYEVITAQSGTEGLKILDNIHDIKIVISDMKMPGMNGLEFIEKAQKKYSNKVYFMLSGYDKTLRIYKALETQLIKNYFTKPFNKRKLVSEIEKNLNQ